MGHFIEQLGSGREVQPDGGLESEQRAGEDRVGGSEAAAACLRVCLVGQEGVAAVEKRGVGGRGGEDAPEDGERVGMPARARVVGYGGRRWLNCLGVGGAFLRFGCRSSSTGSSFCQICVEIIHLFEFILPDIC
jgi:hypothetical protein